MDSEAGAGWRACGRTWPAMAGTALLVLSQAWAWSRVAPLLPPLFPPTRSPSSDVLVPVVPANDIASRLDVLDASLPQAPVIVVAHGRAEIMTSTYMVISMRLWPRPVSLIACEPTPQPEQFRPLRAALRPWRIDVGPLHVSPVLPARVAASTDPRVLCGESAAP